MKKRLLSLVLCVAVFACALMSFVGCSGDKNVEASDNVKPMTVTLTMITSEKTNEEGIKAVEEALNVFTENNLKMHVVLQLYTADEYKDAVDAKLKARERDNEYGIKRTSLGQASDVKVVEIVDGKTRTVTSYPEPYPNQIDIFMVDNYNDLLAYQEEGYLSDISEGITGTAGSLMSKYISQSLLSYGVIDDSNYGVPTNGIYGDYEFIIVKKDLFDKYPYSIEDMKGLSDLAPYLCDVAEKEKIIPLYNVSTMNLISLTGKDSAVAAYVPIGGKEADGYPPGNILSNSYVKGYLGAVAQFSSINGDYPVRSDEIDFNANFAAATLVCDASEIEAYKDDYYMIKTRTPVADAEQIYGSMFAVSAFTSDAVRCVGVINLIETNRDFLNTLLYGVENKTYTVNEDTGVVSRKYVGDTIYIMDEFHCGNIFLAMQNDEMDEKTMILSQNDWKYAKIAASEVTYSPYARFQLVWDTPNDHKGESNYTLISDYADQLEELYDEVWFRLKEYKTFVDPLTGEVMDPASFISQLENWLGQQTAVKNMNSSSVGTSSLRRQYLDWYNAIYNAE